MHRHPTSVKIYDFRGPQGGLSMLPMVTPEG